MKIRMLFENKTVNPKCRPGHGLCMHIETGGKTILFDTGADESILHNAKVMGVDLSAVALLVLSHAHYDHTGGLAHFLAHNDRAIIYLHQTAQGHYCARGDDGFADIGPDRALLKNPRIVFTSGCVKIGDGLSLFSLPEEWERLYPTRANGALYELVDGEYVPDRFLHEQNLLVEEAGRRVLFCGCAHSGIVNILNAAKRYTGAHVDVALGGFHLHNPATKQAERDSLVDAVARDLAGRPTRYYTFHCTGDAALERLRQTLGSQIGTLATGDTLEI